MSYYLLLLLLILIFFQFSGDHKIYISLLIITDDSYIFWTALNWKKSKSNKSNVTSQLVTKNIINKIIIHTSSLRHDGACWLFWIILSRTIVLSTIKKMVISKNSASLTMFYFTSTSIFWWTLEHQPGRLKRNTLIISLFQYYRLTLSRQLFL